MRSTGRNVMLGSAVFLLIAYVLVFVDVYRSDAITVQVVDRATRLPIEGVVVSTDWRATAGHGVSTSEVKILEDVTDSNGVAILPRWGPRIDLSRGAIGSSQPTIRIFKNGYLPQIKTGIGIATRSHNYVAKFSLTDGPVLIDLKLEKAEAALTEYAKSLDLIMGSMTLIVDGFDCAWRMMPALILELREAEAELTSAGVDNHVGSVWSLGNQKNCGEPNLVVEGRKP